MSEPSPITRAVRAGIDSDLTHGAVVPPIYLSTTFTFEEFGVPREFDYARRGNPTRSALAAAVTILLCAAFQRSHGSSRAFSACSSRERMCGVVVMLSALFAASSSS